MHLRNTAHENQIYLITLLRFRVRKWRCKQHLFLRSVPAWAILGGQGWAAVPTLGRRCWNGALKFCWSVEGLLPAEPSLVLLDVSVQAPPAPSRSPSLHLMRREACWWIFPQPWCLKRSLWEIMVSSPRRKRELNLTHSDCLKRVPQSPATLYQVPD